MTPISPRKLRDEDLYRYCEAEETMATKRNGCRDDQDRALVRNRRGVARTPTSRLRDQPRRR
jgi:hypothetical protein